MISNDRETATNHTNYQSAVWVDHHVTGCSYGYSTGKCSILNVNLNFKMSIRVHEFGMYTCLNLQGTVLFSTSERVLHYHHYIQYQSVYQLVLISVCQEMYFYSPNIDHS
jgi:hypothetical protein